MNINFIKLISVALLVTMLAGCGGEDARKAKYFEKSKAYFEQGDYDKAKIELKNVLQIDPKFADAHYLFGEVEAKNKNFRGAYVHYYKAVKLDGDNLEARNKLARLYLLSGELEKAQEQLDEIVTRNPESKHVKMLELLISARKGDTDKAISIAKNIIEKDKSMTDAIFILSNLYMRNRDYENATAVLKEGIANNPEDVALRLQLGGIYSMRKDVANAEKILVGLIELKPENFEYRQRLIKFYIEQKKYDKAESALRDAVKLDSDNESRKLMLVEFLAKYKSVKEAESELLDAIRDYPEAFNLKFAKAKLYEKIKPKEVEGIYKGIIDLDGTGPEGLKARVELANIFLKQGKYEQAQIYISEVLDVNPRSAKALLLKGKIALFNNDMVSAIAAFRSIIKDQPDMVEASRLLALAHMRNKEYELAKETLIRSIESAVENPKPHLNYAQYLISQKEYDEANKEIDKAFKISPTNLEVMKMKLNIASLLSDKDMVAKTIALIKKYHPDNPFGYQKSGDFNMALKNYDKAISEYEKALKLSGKMLPTLASIIKAELSTKNYSAAIERLEKIIAKRPDSAIPKELLGEVYFAKKDFVLAEKFIKEAIKLNPKWSLPYTSLANVYIAKKDISSAVETYKSALKIIPDSVDIYARLAQIYERTGKFDLAINTYEKILQLKPDDALASNNLASILSDVRGDEESLRRARELTLKFEKSDEPGFLDTLGWIYYKSGEYQKSIKILSRVVTKQPDFALFQYHLGMAYYKAGDTKNAKIHLRKSLDGKQKFKGMKEAEKILKQL